MKTGDLVYINFPESFYHGMSGFVTRVGVKVSTVKIDTWENASEIQFYNEQISNDEVSPFMDI